MLGCRRPRDQQAGVEIAGRRYPRAPAPAAARALPIGGDPERPALALTCQIESLGVGRAEHLVRDQPHARRGRPGLEFHSASSFIQNSDFAAAFAASISGLGSTKNRRLNRPVTASTALSSYGIGSNGFAGSSKYIVLTIAK